MGVEAWEIRLMPEEGIQSGTAITTTEYNKLKAKADRLDELLVIYRRHYGNVVEYAIELQEKAEKWNELCEGLEYGGDTPVRDILQEFNLIDRDNQLRRNKLEAVKVWFSGHILSVWNKIPPEGLIVHKRGLEELRKILEGEK